MAQGALPQEALRAWEEPWVMLVLVRWDGKNAGSRRGIICQGGISKDRKWWLRPLSSGALRGMRTKIRPEI